MKCMKQVLTVQKWGDTLMMVQIVRDMNSDPCHMSGCIQRTLRVHFKSDEKERKKISFIVFFRLSPSIAKGLFPSTYIILPLHYDWTILCCDLYLIFTDDRRIERMKCLQDHPFVNYTQLFFILILCLAKIERDFFINDV